MKLTLFFPLLALLNLTPWPSAQGAETARDFSRWEKRIAAFEQEDRTNTPPKNAVLFIGGSTIVLWKTLAQDFPEHRVINRGFGGSQIEDATHFAERVIFPYEPRMIFLRAGNNDLYAGKSPERIPTSESPSTPHPQPLTSVPPKPPPNSAWPSVASA